MEPRNNRPLKKFVAVIILAAMPTFASGASENTKIATFAGGCFWCMEPPFEKLEGVKEVVSGFTGGDKVNPSYEEVARGKTKHIEAVQVTFDPSKTSYQTLLKVFWRNIDPTDPDGQFVDRGHQYSTAIFTHSKEQQAMAEASKKALKASGRFPQKIVTVIRNAGPFYAANDYHQDFYKKKPRHYMRYRKGSGRDEFIQRYWGKQATKSGSKWSQFKRPSKESLKKILTPLQYSVTQEDDTEAPFKNTYWDHKEPGIYVDIVSGEPLFSSTDKFKSGSGWPSFTKPLDPNLIVEKADHSLFMSRVEVRSKYGDSHLGHVFDDGPKPTGLRYCINSAALRFIPASELKASGYGQYLTLFKGPQSTKSGHYMAP